MFSFLKTKSKSSGSPQQHRRGASSSSKGRLSPSEEIQIGTIKKQGDSERFASAMPENILGLTDKLESHKAGTLFKYAVINNKPSDDRTNLMRRLRSFRAGSSVKDVTLNDISAILLREESTSFKLSEAYGVSKSEASGSFILIDSILVHYIPMDSFVCEQSVISIQVNDFRKVNGTCVRRANISSTMGYNLVFTLDYCVQAADLDRMTLSFQCEGQDFQQGTSWAAVKVVVQMRVLDFPQRAPLTDTSGCMIFADTDLEKYMTDPRQIDLVTTPEAMSILRNLHQRKEIENKTIPKNDKKELNTAKTAFSSGDDSEDTNDSKGEDDMMNEWKRRQIAAKKTNLERLREINGLTFVPKRAADPDYVSPTDEADGVLNALTEPGISDSLSQAGESRSEVFEQIRREGDIGKIAVRG